MANNVLFIRSLVGCLVPSRGAQPGANTNYERELNGVSTKEGKIFPEAVFAHQTSQTHHQPEERTQVCDPTLKGDRLHLFPHCETPGPIQKTGPRRLRKERQDQDSQAYKRRRRHGSRVRRSHNET